MITIQKKDFKPLYDIACKECKGKFNDILVKHVWEEEISFDENFVEQMKSACTQEQKPVFEKIFKPYIKADIKDRVKTYSDVCYELGIIELTIVDFRFLPEDEQKSALATHKIKNIAKLFNQGWTPDWKNQNEYKYYPWFEYRNGWGFVGSSGRRSFSYGLPSFFKTKDISDYVGTRFLDIYKDVL